MRWANWEIEIKKKKKLSGLNMEKYSLFFFHLVTYYVIKAYCAG